MNRISNFILAGVLFLAVSGTLNASGFTVKDAEGKDIEITPPAGRVVLLTLYELIPVFDVWDRVAGVNRWAFDDGLLNGFAQLKEIPSVGTADTVNVEVLLALHPDLVITWTYKPEVDEFLARKGLKVISVYPDSLEELYSVIELLRKDFRQGRPGTGNPFSHGREFCGAVLESIGDCSRKPPQSIVALAEPDNSERRGGSSAGTNQTDRRDQSGGRDSSNTPSGVHGVDCDLEPGRNFHLGERPIRSEGNPLKRTVEKREGGEAWEGVQGPRPDHVVACREQPGVVDGLENLPGVF